jgi:hypothetical protein
LFCKVSDPNPYTGESDGTKIFVYDQSCTGGNGPSKLICEAEPHYCNLTFAILTLRPGPTTRFSGVLLAHHFPTGILSYGAGVFKVSRMSEVVVLNESQSENVDHHPSHLNGSQSVNAASAMPCPQGATAMSTCRSILDEILFFFENTQYGQSWPIGAGRARGTNMVGRLGNRSSMDTCVTT